MDKVNFDEDMLKAIKMIIIDVDGTMTDGGYIMMRMEMK